MDNKQFVENLLSETFAEAFRWIDRLEWNDDAEVCDIVCKNGYRYHVNCCMDSKAGIIEDVTKEAMRH